jgi:membrane protein required for beta-lactamase induction
MTLISILVALALEYVLGSLDHLRNWSWYDRWLTWLEQRSGERHFWDGPGGVLVSVGLPLAGLALFGRALADASVIFVFALGTFIFLYSLGADLNSQLDRYTAALHADDDNTIALVEEQLQVPNVMGQTGAERVLRSVFIRSHEQLFGVVFWFIVLGMAGGLLFAMSLRLRRRVGEANTAYAEASRRLYGILSWPSSRAEALGFALAGNLVDTVDGWHKVEDGSSEATEPVLCAAGLCSLSLGKSMAGEADNTAIATQVEEVQALINRTLLVWLTILGIMTIGGWLT